MSQKSIMNRTVIPVCCVFVVAVISMTGYFTVRSMDIGSWHGLITRVLGIGYFVSVAFGTLIVYSTAYVGGASMRERILASFVVPFAWMTKEVLRLVESHPLTESLYWYFNPLNVWLVTLMILEMGIATLIARRMLKKRGAQVRVVTKGPVLVIIGSLIFVISVYAWGRGENVYVIFLAGYRSLFGSGV